LKSITSEKLGLQLSVERAESELTEQKRLTESLQLVSSFFYSHPCVMYFMCIQIQMHSCILFCMNSNFCGTGVTAPSPVDIM